MNLESAHEKIINYCNFKDIDIIRSSSWYATPEENLVSEVWKGKPTRSWVYSMLHELGHIKIYNKTSYSKKNWKRIKEKYSNDNTVVSAVQILREEVEAWEAGLLIAKEIGIDIDREDYDSFLAPSLMGYMKVLSKKYSK